MSIEIQSGNNKPIQEETNDVESSLPGDDRGLCAVIESSAISDEAPRSGPDPFDPETLRLKDATSFGVERVLTTIPVRKPNKQEFVRVHPDPDYRITTAVFADERDRDSVYMVSPGLRDELAGEIIPIHLVTSITRHGNIFLWQLKVSTDGRSNTWLESAASAAELAETHWIRMKSDMDARCYNIARATGPIPDPEWPELSFKEILTLAFKGRFIDSHDHAVLKSLRGEV